MLQNERLTFRITGRPDTESRTVHIDNAFFAALQQETLTGGDLEVTITPQSVAGDIVRFDIRLSGSVTALCDRCLEPVKLPLEVEEQIFVAPAGSLESEADPDILTADPQTGIWDAAWSLYELCETSLPMRRTHAEDDCNTEMLGRIEEEEKGI